MALVRGWQVTLAYDDGRTAPIEDGLYRLRLPAELLAWRQNRRRDPGSGKRSRVLSVSRSKAAYATPRANRSAAMRRRWEWPVILMAAACSLVAAVRG